MNSGYERYINKVIIIIIITRRDTLLASVLPTVACLMGPLTVKVDCRIRAETINLYMICLCDPGAGKSPAFQYGCAQPIRFHFRQKRITLYLSMNLRKLGYSGSLNQRLAIKPSLARRKHPSFLISCWCFQGKELHSHGAYDPVI